MTLWRRANPKKAEAQRQRQYANFKADPERVARHRENNLLHNRKLKIEVLLAYGGVVCACCGESELMFLSIDHINNDGAEERKRLGSSGRKFYLWLRNNDYPPGYQVLCFNCNLGRAFNGGKCPHKE